MRLIEQCSVTMGDLHTAVQNEACLNHVVIRIGKSGQDSLNSLLVLRIKKTLSV